MATAQRPTPANPKSGQQRFRIHVAPRRNTTVKPSRIYMQRRLAPEDDLFIVMAETGTAGVTTAPRGSQVPSPLAGEG